MWLGTYGDWSRLIIHDPERDAYRDRQHKRKAKVPVEPRQTVGATHICPTLAVHPVTSTSSTTASCTAAVTALSRSGLFDERWLPHYRRRLSMQKLDLLSVLYLPQPWVGVKLVVGGLKVDAQFDAGKGRVQKNASTIGSLQRVTANALIYLRITHYDLRPTTYKKTPPHSVTNHRFGISRITQPNSTTTSESSAHVHFRWYDQLASCSSTKGHRIF